VLKTGPQRGIKAKTIYPPRPANWPEPTWMPDVAFALVQADLLRGKSIGFLPTKVHVPDRREMEKNGWQDVSLVIDQWILLEYACVYLPAQQNAVVETVSKSYPELPETVQKALGIYPIASQTEPLGEISFLSLEEIHAALNHHVSELDLVGFANNLVQLRLDQARGRV
jgi:hypothetical protein